MEPEPSICSDCGGTGWRLNEQTGLVSRCECTLGKDVTSRLRAARIPARYEHCTLDTYDPLLVNTDGKAQFFNESQTAAKALARRFIEQFPWVDGGLLFVGNAGVGKTHLAVAILKSLVEDKGVRGLFYDFRDLLRDIQHSWNPVSQSSELEVLRPVLEAELLVLDELGANKPTAWVQDTMTHIINSRYNEKRITIFTSNYPDREDPPGRGAEGAVMRREESLTDRVGARLRSRLYEMCTRVEISGEDFRKKVRQSSYRFK